MDTVLVIDDDPDILDALQFVLLDAGYNVVATQFGEDAEKLIHAKQLPKLIILDILLSGKDGRDVTKILKTHKKTKDIPIILISAQPDIKKSAIDAGADAFIAKPFDIQSLLTEVATHV